MVLRALVKERCATLRGLKVAHGLEVIVEDIEVALKTHDVVDTRAACMNGCAWHIEMEENLEKKQRVMYDRVGLQSITQLAKNRKKRSN